MRDPKRIEECLYLINEHWQMYPDVRFNQLIHNLQSLYHTETDDGIEIQDSNGNWGFDMFYVEDDKWIEWLKNKVNS
jgi:hypothetical protein